MKKTAGFPTVFLQNHSRKLLQKESSNLDNIFSIYSIDFDDFDAIANTDPMTNLLLKKNVVKKPSNHRNRKSRNPVKALANRTDIKNTYNQHDKTAILIQSNSEEDSPGN